MMPDGKIKNSRELEFAVFCIENVAAKLGVGAERVYRAFTEKGDILHGYTVTKIEILQSFKGEVAGTPVSITEEYYTTQNMAGTTIWTQGNYLPAKEGGEYIFFLKAYEPGSKYEGMYFPVDLERGKYVVGIPDTFVPEKRGNVSAEILELKGDKDIMEYWKWYEQVAGKYIR